MKFSSYLFFFFIFLSANTFAQIEKNDSTTAVKEGWILIDTIEYSISYPEDWENKEATKKIIQFSLTSPLTSPKDLITDNISLGKDKFGKQNYSLTRYGEMNITNLKKSLNKFKLLSNEKKTLNGNDCIRLVFLTKVGKINLQQLKNWDLQGI